MKSYMLLLVVGVLLFSLSFFDPGVVSSPVTGFATYDSSVGNTTIYECGGIVSPGVYTLNQSLFADMLGQPCIEILADDVVVDGAGFVVSGSEDVYGISVGVCKNVTVKNMLLTGLSTGVSVYDSENISLENTIVQNNKDGFRFSRVINPVLINNSFFSNEQGLDFSRVINATLQYNNVSGNEVNFDMNGDSNKHFIHSIDTTNILDYSYNFYIQESISDIMFTPANLPAAGIIACTNCTNVSYDGFTLDHNTGFGLLLFNTTNAKILNTGVVNNTVGLVLSHLSFSNLQDNVLKQNLEGGIFLENSMNNTVEQNVINSSYKGLYVGLALNTTIRENSLYSNAYGVELYKTNLSFIQGNLVKNSVESNILLKGSSFNDVADNFLVNSSINLHSTDSSASGGKGTTDPVLSSENSYVNNTFCGAASYDIYEEDVTATSINNNSYTDNKCDEARFGDDAVGSFSCDFSCLGICLMADNCADGTCGFDDTAEKAYFISYSPMQVGERLCDNLVLYSAGEEPELIQSDYQTLNSTLAQGMHDWYVFCSDFEGSENVTFYLREDMGITNCTELEAMGLTCYADTGGQPVFTANGEGENYTYQNNMDITSDGTDPAFLNFTYSPLTGYSDDYCETCYSDSSCSTLCVGSQESEPPVEQTPTDEDDDSTSSQTTGSSGFPYGSRYKSFSANFSSERFGFHFDELYYLSFDDSDNVTSFMVASDDVESQLLTLSIDGIDYELACGDVDAVIFNSIVGEVVVSCQDFASSTYQRLNFTLKDSPSFVVEAENTSVSPASSQESSQDAGVVDDASITNGSLDSDLASAGGNVSTGGVVTDNSSQPTVDEVSSLSSGSLALILVGVVLLGFAGWLFYRRTIKQ